MKGVDVLEGGALGQQQEVRVAAGADGRVGAQRPILGEILAGGEELPFILRARLGITALPGGVELKKVNLAKVRLAMAAMVVLTTASLAAEAASGAATQRPPRITIAILPHGTSPAELAEVDGMAIGLLSAGIGSVPPAQTWIDIGQGARLNESLYDEGLPRLFVDPGVGGAPPHVPPSVWQRVRDRAQAAPADLVPGLLGATLRRGGVSSAAHHPVEPSAAILVGAKGAILEGRQCRQRPALASRS